MFKKKPKSPPDVDLNNLFRGHYTRQGFGGLDPDELESTDKAEKEKKQADQAVKQRPTRSGNTIIVFYVGSDGACRQTTLQ